jgi:hypothetical protein
MPEPGQTVPRRADVACFNGLLLIPSTALVGCRAPPPPISATAASSQQPAEAVDLLQRRPCAVRMIEAPGVLRYLAGLLMLLCGVVSCSQSPTHTCQRAGTPARRLVVPGSAQLRRRRARHPPVVPLRHTQVLPLSYAFLKKGRVPSNFKPTRT